MSRISVHKGTIFILFELITILDKSLTNMISLLILFPISDDILGHDSFDLQMSQADSEDLAEKFPDQEFETMLSQIDESEYRHDISPKSKVKKWVLKENFANSHEDGDEQIQSEIETRLKTLQS